MSNKNDDPLAMGGLKPEVIAATVASNGSKKQKPPSELDLMKEERLRSKEDRLKDMKQIPLEKTPAKTAEKPVDTQQLLDKIGAYKERFPELRTRNPKLSAKSSVEEMEDELHFIELQLGSSRDNSLGSMLFVGAMVGIETLTLRYNPMNLRLEGLGKVAKDNLVEFTPLIDELMIKYSSGLYVTPEMRLALAVGSLVMTVHSANSGDSRLADAIQRVSQPVKKPAGSDSL